MNTILPRVGFLPRRDPLVLFSAAVSLLYVVLMGRMVDGSLINSYPFISDDGFDWILQGLAFHEWLSNGNLSPWPVLRNPVYVLISAMDASLQANGRFLIAAQGAAIFATLSALSWIGRQFRQPDPIIAAFLFAFAFMPMAYFRFWILSDTVAMSFITVGIASLLKHHADPADRKFLLIAVAMTLLAGLTQTYGLIPFCVMASLMAVERFLRTRRIPVSLALSALGVLVLCLVLQKAWEWAIPHGTRPENFSLLRLKLDMLGFYTNVWSISFLPFVPAAVLLLTRPRLPESAGSTAALHLFAACMAFVVLTFFYQWPEARFTYVYMPVFFSLLLVLLPYRGSGAPARFAFLSALAYGLMGLLILPGEYWKPQLAGVRFAPNRTWIGEALATPPVDRFQLHAFCPTIDVICSEAPVPENISVYRLAILNDYKARQVSAASSGRLGAAKPVSARLPPSLALTTPGEMASRKAAPDRSSGYVDVIKRIDDRLLIEGWSLDRIARQPASRIWVVLEGETRFVTIPTVQRDDVTSHFGLTGALKAGFSFVVTIPPELGPQRPAVRVLAEMRDATFTELEIDEKSVQ